MFPATCAATQDKIDTRATRTRWTPRVGVRQNRKTVTMGEIRASVTLENRDDGGAVRLGLRAEADVRRTTVEGVVDTGAVSLVIPEEIATQLGLQDWGTRTVVYADERREERPVTDVTIEIGTSRRGPRPSWSQREARS